MMFEKFTKIMNFGGKLISEIEKLCEKSFIKKAFIFNVFFLLPSSNNVTHAINSLASLILICIAESLLGIIV